MILLKIYGPQLKQKNPLLGGVQGWVDLLQIKPGFSEKPGLYHYPAVTIHTVTYLYENYIYFFYN